LTYSTAVCDSLGGSVCFQACVVNCIKWLCPVTYSLGNLATQSRTAEVSINSNKTATGRRTHATQTSSCAVTTLHTTYSHVSMFHFTQRHGK